MKYDMNYNRKLVGDLYELRIEHGRDDDVQYRT